jgi:hypothetical protein
VDRLKKQPTAGDQLWENRSVTLLPRLAPIVLSRGGFVRDPVAHVPPSGTLMVRSCWTFQLMRWVRTNRRRGSWLALAAIALQLVLSFGHIHLPVLASSSAVTSVTASETPSSEQNPAHHPANEAEDFCAICATIHLASSSFLPEAPLLLVPFASQTIEHFGNFTFAFISPQRAAFQSRAPPLA